MGTQPKLLQLTERQATAINIARLSDRARGGLPQQSLEQEMALLGLTIPDTNQIRTANPAKLETDGMRTNASSLDRVGEIAQPLFPPEALEDVSL